MITTAQMYWIVILDNIVVTSTILAAVGAIGSIFMLIGHTVDGWPRWPVVTCLAVTFAALMTLTFVPSTKQAAAILVVPSIVNSKKVQTVGNRLYDLAVEWLDELKPEKGAK